MKDLEVFLARLSEAQRAIYDLRFACHDIAYAADLDHVEEALNAMARRARAEADKQ